MAAALWGTMLGKLQTERGGGQNAATAMAIGNVTPRAVSKSKWKCLFSDEFLGLYLFVSDSCLVGQQLGCFPTQANWESGEGTFTAVGAEAP